MPKKRACTPNTILWGESWVDQIELSTLKRNVCVYPSSLPPTHTHPTNTTHSELLHTVPWSSTLQTLEMVMCMTETRGMCWKRMASLLGWSQRVSYATAFISSSFYKAHGSQHTHFCLSGVPREQPCRNVPFCGTFLSPHSLAPLESLRHRDKQLK